MTRVLPAGYSRCLLGNPLAPDSTAAVFAFAVAFGAVIRGDDHGCGYLVVEVEEFDAHGGSAGGADLPGVDAEVLDI